MLLIVGVLSLAIRALFLRRTNNYKRFLSRPSKHRNRRHRTRHRRRRRLGRGVPRRLPHLRQKSSLFLQMAVVRQVYNGYRINRIGDYIPHQPRGGRGAAHGHEKRAGGLPPRRSSSRKAMILRETVPGNHWWLVAVLLLLLCIVIYSFCSRMIRLCYQPNQDELHPQGRPGAGRPLAAGGSHGAGALGPPA